MPIQESTDQKVAALPCTRGLAAPATCPRVGRDVEEGEQPVLLCGGQEHPKLDDSPHGARLLAYARGRLARSTGLLPMSASTMTASPSAFRSTACRWVTVATASG